MSATYFAKTKPEIAPGLEPAQWLLRGLSASVSGMLFPINDRLTIGRDPSCTIVLHQPEVSRTHLLLLPTAAGVSMLDFRSSNGSWVNGKQISKALLKTGDRLGLGATLFELLNQPNYKEEKSRKLTPGPSLARSVGRRSYQLLLESGNMRGLSVPLDGERFTLGRSPDNDLVFKEPSLSRLHAIFYYTGAQLNIADQGSTNGSAVNQQPISESNLNPGDKLRLGDLVMRVEQKTVKNGKVFDPTATLKSWVSRLQQNS